MSGVSMGDKYKIVRYYSKPPKNGRGHLETKRRTVHRGLTLEQAQAHCKDKKTSSLEAGRKKAGWEWFDGYTLDN